MVLLREALLVGLGGFFGSAARFLMSSAVQKLAGPAGFPYGTLSVNLVGAFLVGVLMQSVAQTNVFSPQVKLLLGVGFLGGFTTLSTVTLESMRLVQTGQPILGLSNAFGSIALGLFMTGLGFWTAQIVLR